MNWFNTNQIDKVIFDKHNSVNATSKDDVREKWLTAYLRVNKYVFYADKVHPWWHFI